MKPSASPIRALFALCGALCGLSALSACKSADPDSFAPECVPVGILAAAADSSSFAGPSHDLSTLVTQASIAAVNGSCSDAEQGRALHTRMSVVISVMRGPAATTRDLTIPYFVAVLHGSDIVAKHDRTIEAHFPPNADRLALKSDPLELDLPISRRMRSDTYRLEVGLQLTPEQLAYNRAHMPH
jgi:hypothetical protein